MLAVPVVWRWTYSAFFANAIRGDSWNFNRIGCVSGFRFPATHAHTHQDEHIHQHLDEFKDGEDGETDP